jgi:membrane-associated phospholipid phosphatase
MRLKEESASIWESAPDVAVDVASILTMLGGTEGIILLLSITYWLVHRRNGATVASYAVAGVVFVLLVKTLFGLPRPVPDEAMAVERVVPLEDDPHGFPSGHAFMSVVVYGGLVRVFDRARAPLALAAAGLLVVVISLTRIVLRLHYLGDVIAGAVLGVGFLLVMAIVVDRDPRKGFAIGLALAVPAALISGFEELTLVGLGSALGGLVASAYLDAIPELHSRIEGAVLTLSGLVYIVVVMVVTAALTVEGPAGHAAVLVGHAVLLGGIFALPVAVNRIESYRRRRLNTGNS